MKRSAKKALFLALFFLQACGQSNMNRPKLIVTIVVDQMRSDHLTRFKDLYGSGIARLLEGGMNFTNAHHDHAYTVTAAGHATIATGQYPSHNGIVGNNWVQRDTREQVYCCADTSCPILGYENVNPKSGRSPANLLTPTLADRLKEKNPRSLVYGVSRKDRSAIFSTGKKADGAYWYNSKDGRFVTSEYYAQVYPDWVAEFNKSGVVDGYFAKGWRRLLSEDYYSAARQDSFYAENDGKHTTFPHLFTRYSDKPDPVYYNRLQSTPFMDELVFSFAKELVRNENLGQDEITDFLAVGCSSADAIGHDFGPRSRESLDHFLRLDRYIGDFLDFLDGAIGSGHYIVVLSSDHGVLPLPEDLSARGVDARRISDREFIKSISKGLQELQNRTGISESLILKKQGYGLYMNYQAAREKGLSDRELDKQMVNVLLKSPYIADVFTREELETDSGQNREFKTAYRNSYHPQRSADLTVRLKEFYLVRSSRFGTSHGSPYNYDTHVPLIFYGPGILAGQISDYTRTVDIAPTLATMLDIDSGSMDGNSLIKLISQN